MDSHEKTMVAFRIFRERAREREETASSNLEFDL